MPAIDTNEDAAADIIELMMASPCTSGVPDEAMVLTALKRHQIQQAVFW